jgi:uncharacterized SAM-binding protein YcdF (DUF218 family)
VFLLKKIISAFLLPPGCIIIILFVAGIWYFRHRCRSCGIFSLTLGLILWILSLGPTANFLMKRLESGLTIPAHINGDVIVLLGGGANDSVQDLSGIGVPSDDMMSRLVTAVRAQKRTGIPVLVSGGPMEDKRIPESWIVRRFLHDLGVPASKILVEDRSRDTVENARYVSEICSRFGFRRLILVTSAYHMKRAQLAFQQQNLAVIPLPASLRYDARNNITPYTYLPSAMSFASTATALHEQLGLLFYRWTLPATDSTR